MAETTEKKEEPTVTVRFLKDYVVRDDSGDRYAKGQIVDFPESSANHFLHRDLAERVDQPVRANQGRRSLGNQPVTVPQQPRLRNQPFPETNISPDDMEEEGDMTATVSGRRRAIHDDGEPIFEGDMDEDGQPAGALVAPKPTTNRPSAPTGPANRHSPAAKQSQQPAARTQARQSPPKGPMPQSKQPAAGEGTDGAEKSDAEALDQGEANKPK